MCERTDIEHFKFCDYLDYRCLSSQIRWRLLISATGQEIFLKLCLMHLLQSVSRLFLQLYLNCFFTLIDFVLLNLKMFFDFQPNMNLQD